MRRGELVGSWLFAACLLLENVCFVSKYAPGRNLNVCQLPTTQNEQKMNFFSDIAKIAPELLGTCWECWFKSLQEVFWHLGGRAV